MAHRLGRTAAAGAAALGILAIVDSASRRSSPPTSIPRMPSRPRTSTDLPAMSIGRSPDPPMRRSPSTYWDRPASRRNCGVCSPAISSTTAHPKCAKSQARGTWVRAQMVYVGAGRAHLLRSLVPVPGRASMLLVTDEEEGLTAGSTLNFLTVDRNVRFEVSLTAADRWGLKISSELLGVAIRVQGSKHQSAGRERPQRGPANDSREAILVDPRCCNPSIRCQASSACATPCAANS